MKEKKEKGFDRDIHNNIKHALTFNIHSSTFKDSIVNTSGFTYWKIYFDPDDKDDRFLYVTQSSEEEYIDMSDGKEMENKKGRFFLFYYSYKSTCYSLSCLPP